MAELWGADEVSDLNPMLKVKLDILWQHDLETYLHLLSLQTGGTVSSGPGVRALNKAKSLFARQPLADARRSALRRL